MEEKNQTLKKISEVIKDVNLTLANIKRNSDKIKKKSASRRKSSSNIQQTEKKSASRRKSVSNIQQTAIRAPVSLQDSIFALGHYPGRAEFVGNYAQPNKTQMQIEDYPKLDFPITVDDVEDYSNLFGDDYESKIRNYTRRNSRENKLIEHIKTAPKIRVLLILTDGDEVPSGEQLEKEIFDFFIKNDQDYRPIKNRSTRLFHYKSPELIIEKVVVDSAFDIDKFKSRKSKIFDIIYVRSFFSKKFREKCISVEELKDLRLLLWYYSQLLRQITRYMMKEKQDIAPASEIAKKITESYGISFNEFKEYNPNEASARGITFIPMLSELCRNLYDTYLKGKVPHDFFIEIREPTRIMPHPDITRMTSFEALLTECEEKWTILRKVYLKCLNFKNEYYRDSFIKIIDLIKYYYRDRYTIVLGNYDDFVFNDFFIRSHLYRYLRLNKLKIYDLK